MFRKIVKKYGGDIWNKESSEKYMALIEGVIDLYRIASSRQERLQTLSLIAPMMRYLELQNYMPGIPLYAYKAARRYAKMTKASMPQPKIDPKKERYDHKKFESFIGFITCSTVITDMPFGLSTGEKMELPNMIRTTVNQRIIHNDVPIVSTRYDQENLKLSESSMW